MFEDPYESYINQITGTQIYNSLLSWVYTYQITPKLYSREDIDKAYHGLISYIYNQYIKIKISELL